MILTMFTYQAVIAFLAFVVGLLFIVVNLKRWIRRLHKTIYAYILNKVVDVLAEDLKGVKEKIFGHVHEMARERGTLKVVEIGAGAGANFQYLPKNTEIICVEPNEFFKDYLFARTAELTVDLRLGVAENMHFVASESVDVVIGTLVLCSVEDVDQCLREILRILKKGGKYVFLEHILAEDGTSIQFMQYLIRPLWRFLVDNCTLTRRTDISIQKAGFSTADIDIFQCNFRRPMFITRLFQRNCAGVATK